MPPRIRPNKSQSKQSKQTKESVFTVTQKDTLLAFLLSQLPQKKRGLLKAVLHDNQVSVNNIPVRQFDHILVPGAQVRVSWERQEQPTSPKLKIIFEDNDLIVIDKPAGLLTISTDKVKKETAFFYLSEHIKLANPASKLFIIHRLDRETSGLLLFAKNREVKLQIQENWVETVNQRTYVGVVEGAVEKTEGTITSWLAETTAYHVHSTPNTSVGKKAVTNFHKLGGNSRYSLLQLNLDTGRKHQIRVHMQDMGHPIVGDKKYGAHGNPIRRMALHAQVLSFTHPVTGQMHRFETAIPPSFLRITGQEKA